MVALAGHARLNTKIHGRLQPLGDNRSMKFLIILGMLAALSGCGGSSSEIDRLRNQNAALNHDIERLERSGAKLRDQLQQAQDAIDDAQDAIASARTRLQNMPQSVDGVDDATDDLDDASDALDDAADAVDTESGDPAPVMTHAPLLLPHSRPPGVL